MLRTTVYLIYKKQKTKRKENKMHTHTQKKKAEQKTQNKTKQKIPRNPNKQTRTIRLFKLYHASFISCPSLVYAVSLEHRNAHAICLENEEKYMGTKTSFNSGSFVSQEGQVCNESRNMIKKKKS